MPYPNEHAARLRDPGDFKEKPDWSSSGKFRRTSDGTIFGQKKVPETVDVIWGQLENQSGDSAAPQSLRFPTANWTEAEARKWLKDNEVELKGFEPAAPESSAERQEERCFTNGLIEILDLREDQPTSRRTIAGYGAVHYRATEPGTEYKWMENAYERIMPGAFDEVVKSGADVAICWNHNKNRLLGRTSSGTARISVDDRGLRYEVDLPETGDAADLLALISRGDISGSSIGFRVAKGGDRWIQQAGLEIREVTKIRYLRDTGPVTWPAYEATTVGLRAEGSGELVASYEAWKDQRIQAELERQKERNKWLHRRARLRTADL